MGLVFCVFISAVISVAAVVSFVRLSFHHINYNLIVLIFHDYNYYRIKQIVLSFYKTMAEIRLTGQRFYNTNKNLIYHHSKVVIMSIL